MLHGFSVCKWTNINKLVTCISLFGLLMLITAWTPYRVLAQAYGSGSYGGGNYGSGDNIPAAPTSLAQYREDGVTGIGNGNSLSNGATMIVKMTMTSASPVDTLTPQVEIQHQETAFTGIPNYSGSPVSFSGSAVTGTITILNLGGGNFHWQARVSNTNGGSPWTAMGGSPDFTVEYSNGGNGSSCTDPTPTGKAPELYAAVPQGSSAVQLYLTSADGPINHYVLEYGTISGSYQYGVTNIGNQDIRTYLVRSLAPETTYYFRVRAGNGCATGSPSNEIFVKTTSSITFNQLQITDSSLQSSAPDTIPSDNPCQIHTVTSGDTLWSIAKNIYGDSTQYGKIIDENKDTYPELAKSKGLKIGWKLKVNCLSQMPTDRQIEGQPQTYVVKVKVIDTQNKPVPGAKVTIHSKVKETTTNQAGVAEFSDIDPGQHRILIAYNGYQGEQTVNLTGEVKEFNLNVTVKPVSIFLDPKVILLVGVLSGLILILAVRLVRANRRERAS